MAFNNQSYVLGSGKVPTWLNDEASKGRVKFNYDDGDFINAIVFTPTQTVTANKGDVVLSLKSGLAVLPADKAKQYSMKGDNKDVQK